MISVIFFCSRLLWYTATRRL